MAKKVGQLWWFRKKGLVHSTNKKYTTYSKVGEENKFEMTTMPFANFMSPTVWKLQP